MIEIERKILNIDPEKIKAKLEELNAKKTFEGTIKTYYFDYPDLRIQKQQELLRVRQMGNQKIEVVLKTNPRTENNCKIFDEKEFKVTPSELDNVIDFLKSLGFIQTLYFEKHRSQYQIETTKFELDTYPHIAPLLEIEAINQSDIDLYTQKLDLNKNETSTETIDELTKRLTPNQKLDGQMLP